MTLSQIISTPCTLILNSQADTSEDGYGNEKPADPPELETVCSLQQARRDEPDDQGELSDTDWRIYFPAGTEAATGDQVTVGDRTFEFVGDPWHVGDPWKGQESHVEASVRLAG